MAADFTASLQPDELPEVVLKTAREVELKDRARDVVMFAGSTTWHLRRRAARSLNLYLKFNDFGCDPLGEDPATAEQRRSTVSALRQSDRDLDGLVPVISRRLDTIARLYMRNGQEPLQATLFGEEPFGITELQFQALRAREGPREPLSRAIAELGRGADPAEVRSALLYLADRGAIELVG